jgi:hypothetical protein
VSPFWDGSVEDVVNTMGWDKVRTVPIDGLDELSRRIDELRELTAAGRDPTAVEVVATGNWGLLDVREGWDAARLRDEAAGLAALGVDRIAMIICGDDPGAAEDTVRRLGEDLLLPVIEEKERG